MLCPYTFSSMINLSLDFVMPQVYHLFLWEDFCNHPEEIDRSSTSDICWCCWKFSYSLCSIEVVVCFIASIWSVLVRWLYLCVTDLHIWLRSSDYCHSAMIMFLVLFYVCCGVFSISSEVYKVWCIIVIARCKVKVLCVLFLRVICHFRRCSFMWNPAYVLSKCYPSNCISYILFHFRKWKSYYTTMVMIWRWSMRYFVFKIKRPFLSYF